MSIVNLKVNGRSVAVDVDPTTPLLYVLRNDLDLHGPRFGCGLGQCGACTVIVEGEAIRSCITPVDTVQGFAITTLEGLSVRGKLDPVQQAWVDKQSMLCGFCQNGQIMNAKVLLSQNPNPTDTEIREFMQGILCRCFTFHKVQGTIRYAATLIAAAKSTSAKEVLA